MFYPTGGYCKEYAKGKRPVGVILDDTWFLKCVSIHSVTHACALTGDPG